MRTPVSFATSADGTNISRTLILHADGDRAVPFEQGRRLAGLIPGARFVPLHSHNHILLADEPAWPAFLAEVTAFVGGPGPSATKVDLTVRELEVLRLVARGCSNQEIASLLSLSTRTVERHLSNIYVRLELTGRSARAAAAARLPGLERSATPA
jgi:DNA-binding NarL/FixJ family response regulator